jgi:RNA polymerase sigma-70 factor (ECF subfamily)
MEARLSADVEAKLLTNLLAPCLAAEEHMSTVTLTNISGEALEREFEELFREHCQLVYRTAYSVTGNRQDAEDVLQSIFLKLLQREFLSALMKSPRAYLYRAAVNLALNTVRSRKHKNIVGNVELLEAPQRVSANGAADGVNGEMRRNLLHAISRFKPRVVEVLVLRYEHNYSDAEIAKMLGKSRGTIAVTLNRARSRLKKLLRASSEGDRL